MRRSEFQKKVAEASDTELDTMLEQEREGLYKMRQQIALKQLNNPHAITKARKNVARILGAMRSREAGTDKGS